MNSTGSTSSSISWPCASRRRQVRLTTQGASMRMSCPVAGHDRTIARGDWHMDTEITRPTSLLGGLAPRDFMRRHWQKTPLVVRAAVPDAARVASRADVLALAAREGVESRLVARDGEHWTLRHG